jgi:hypothetical protein
MLQNVVHDDHVVFRIVGKLVDGTVKHGNMDPSCHIFTNGRG